MASKYMFLFLPKIQKLYLLNINILLYNLHRPMPLYLKL